MPTLLWINQQIAQDKENEYRVKKQGRLHGNLVEDGWAGAVGQKPLRIQNMLATD